MGCEYTFIFVSHKFSLLLAGTMELISERIVRTDSPGDLDAMIQKFDQLFGTSKMVGEHNPMFTDQEYISLPLDTENPALFWTRWFKHAKLLLDHSAVVATGNSCICFPYDIKTLSQMKIKYALSTEVTNAMAAVIGSKWIKASKICSSAAHKKPCTFEEREKNFIHPQSYIGNNFQVNLLIQTKESNIAGHLIEENYYEAHKQLKILICELQKIHSE